MVKRLRARWKPLLVHILILSGFLLFIIFLSPPLFDRFESIDGESKLQSVSLPAETECISYCILAVHGGTDVMEIQGWAFVDDQSFETGQLCVVLKSDRKCYVIDTMTLRWDNDDPWPPGFVCNIPSGKISSGEYHLGIYIKKGDTEAFQCTDTVLVKAERGLSEQVSDHF
jgi:hypothetical protein